MAKFIRPIAGSPPITDDFSEHVARKSVNPGTDYAVRAGTPVLAPAAGIVKVADSNPDGAAGRVVVIFFDNGWSTDLIHLSKLSCKVGDRVAQGEEVAESGGSANGSNTGVGNHLHASLRNRQSTGLGGAGNVDPEAHFGEAAEGGNIDVANRQRHLNRIGYSLKVDNKNGPKTKAAIEGYQKDLTAQGFYKGQIDGLWGPQMEAAHVLWSAANPVNAPAPAPTPAPAPAPAPAASGNRFGLSNVEGLQKIARKYGYTGPIDNIWGPGSQAGFDKFLAANHGRSLSRWLKVKYGYSGNQVYGPNMQAALARANAANNAAL